MIRSFCFHTVFLFSDIFQMKRSLFGAFALALAAAAAAAQTTPVPDIPPAEQGWQVVINIPQQRLFLYSDGKLHKVYPVAVGKALTQTILGEHKIGAKAFNPTWHIPKSIQRERGDGVISVPPGPRNPLGPVFVRLGNPKLGLGIHGTNAPASVPGVRSHGCVRMKSPDALQFARTVTTGTPATVSYELAALNVDDADNLWLAVFKDPYNKRNLKSAALKQSIESWAQEKGVSISDAKINQIIKAKRGVPVCLSCTAGGKIKGSLRSLAWNSGSAQPTGARSGGYTDPSSDEVMPEGSEIEIDAGVDVDTPLPAFKGTSVFDDAPMAGETSLIPTNR